MASHRNISPSYAEAVARLSSSAAKSVKQDKTASKGTVSRLRYETEKRSLTGYATETYVDAGDASTLESAQSYADEAAASAAAGVDLSTYATIEHSDAGDASTLESAQAADAETLSEAEAYADEADISTLSEAEAYADTGDASVLSEAQSYADNGDASTLSSAESYTDAAVAEAIAGVYVVRGSCTFADLPDDAEVGDVWNVTDGFELDGEEYEAGTNVVWTDDGWDALAASVDLSAYATTEYVDAQDASMLSEAEAYADSGDATTLTSAQSYADDAASDVLTSAQEYADSGDAEVLEVAEAAQSTADSAVTAAAAAQSSADAAQETADDAASAAAMAQSTADAAGRLLGHVTMTSVDADASAYGTAWGVTCTFDSPGSDHTLRLDLVGGTWLEQVDEEVLALSSKMALCLQVDDVNQNAWTQVIHVWPHELDGYTPRNELLASIYFTADEGEHVARLYTYGSDRTGDEYASQWFAAGTGYYIYDCGLTP